MPRRIADQKTKSRPSAFEREGLLGAARAVVRVHALRDEDRASDEDVSDAIADLESCLPRRQKQTLGKT
jgi:hypothetical protein